MQFTIIIVIVVVVVNVYICGLFYNVMCRVIVFFLLLKGVVLVL